MVTATANYIGESHVLEHRRAVESMNFSSSALAVLVHAWEHSHHIDWTSASVLEVDSHYHLRLSRDTQSPWASIGIGVLSYDHLKPQKCVASHTTEKPITVVLVRMVFMCNSEFELRIELLITRMRTDFVIILNFKL